MPQLSNADHSESPPRISIPRDYNAAYDLIERNLAAGRGDKLAYIDDKGEYTYAQLAERVNKAANMLTAMGNLTLSHLMDRKLYPFTSIKPSGRPDAGGDKAFDEDDAEACASPAVEPAAQPIRVHRGDAPGDGGAWT